MERTVLGRTGLPVSVVGLGCGGRSRIGLHKGLDHAVRVVHKALDLGITFFDTSCHYGTEEPLGIALKGRRSDVIIATKTKTPIYPRPLRAVQALPGMPRRHYATRAVSAFKLRRSLEQSLRRLQTDYIDVFNIHGVGLNQYPQVADELVPELIKLRDEGKIRAFGVTESFINDRTHTMLRRALADDLIDVAMVGFNFLNPSARDGVLDQARERGTGILMMYAVRQALRDLDSLEPVLDDLIARGDLAREDRDLRTLMDALDTTPERIDLTDIAYRFSRYEPGGHVILTGTGNPDHLERNVASILAPPLPEAAAGELRRLFGHLDLICGDNGIGH